MYVLMQEFIPLFYSGSKSETCEARTSLENNLSYVQGKNPSTKSYLPQSQFEGSARIRDPTKEEHLLLIIYEAQCQVVFLDKSIQRCQYAYLVRKDHSNYILFIKMVDTHTHQLTNIPWTNDYKFAEQQRQPYLSIQKERIYVNDRKDCNDIVANCNLLRKRITDEMNVTRCDLLWTQPMWTQPKDWLNHLYLVFSLMCMSKCFVSCACVFSYFSCNFIDC